ncbi:MAG: HD domain-containing protein [Clostridiaceae bacterium]|nr:HD domain-containing protein [Clostridiaceae bacterium]
MRKIYFIRHGLPEFPDGKRVCIGHTDLPVSPVGRMQALLAAKFLDDADISAVFCSRLKRAIQTAEPFGKAKTIDGLEEMDFGEWDGFSFDEIKIRWPDFYEARGRDNSIQPPGAENPQEAFLRFNSALRKILESSTGNIVIVSHASVMCTFLSKISGKELPPGRELLPYGSVSELSLKNDIFTIEYMGKLNRPQLTKELCLELIATAGTPEHVIRHSEAVAKEAERIGITLAKSGLNLDIDLIIRSALLHDVARTKKSHCKVGENWISALGYRKEAEIVGGHCDNYLFEIPDELAVLIVADRIVSEDEVVGLHERIKRQAAKFKTEEAKKKLTQVLEITEKNIETINRICGQKLVKL